MAKKKEQVSSFEKSWIRLPSVPYMTNKAYDCILSLQDCKAINDTRDRDLHHLPPREWSLRGLAVSLSLYSVILMCLIFHVEVTLSASLVGACL